MKYVGDCVVLGEYPARDPRGRGHGAAVWHHACCGIDLVEGRDGAVFVFQDVAYAEVPDEARPIVPVLS